MSDQMSASCSSREVWKDIVGYIGVYQVSNQGRVRRTRARSDSAKKDVTINRLLKPTVKHHGYLSVCLCWKNKKKNYFIHRLVASAFFVRPTLEHEVNHKSGIKSDNSTGNLEWVTEVENHQHAADNGLAYRGELSSSAKITEEQAREIRSIGVDKSIKLREIGEVYGLSTAAISSILTGRTWSHIGGCLPLRIKKSESRASALANLSAQDVIEAFALYKTGNFTHGEIGKRFGFSKSTSSNIANLRGIYGDILRRYFLSQGVAHE